MGGFFFIVVDPELEDSQDLVWFGCMYGVILTGSARCGASQVTNSSSGVTTSVVLSTEPTHR